ncbi:MAG: efflux RND transporter permease subunit [Pseudonocardiales bacterium]|nr:efflux RND transporter permease subunit [Pseudonocardiales bacterium]
MLRWIVGSSLKGRFLVVALAGALLFFGTLSLRHSPVDVFPEFAPTRVEVQTACLGLTSAEVESLVTVPIEQAMSGIAGLETVRSKSVAQLSSVDMIFKDGNDELAARQLVQERIAQVAPNLPTWAAPPMIRPPLSATSRTMHIGMTSKTINLLDLSNVAYWTVRNKLLGVPGVANVAIWGERLDLQQIQVDPKRMAAAGVSLDQVMETASNTVDAGLLQFANNGSAVGTGGSVETPNQRLSVEQSLPLVTAKDFTDVPVEGENHKPVKLGDVANLVRDHQPLFGDAIIGDAPGLMLVVEKFPWGNALDVNKGVEKALDDLRPGLQGIDFDTTIFRPATFIEDALHNLTTSLVLGALLMVIMLGAFLYEWRTALISVVAIPLALLAAALVFHAQGITINTMILAGFIIALGDIVDDAIVDVENVYRRLTEARAKGSTVSAGKSTARIILEASMEVRGAIVYATLIEVVAVTPIILLPGLSGSFFRPLAIAYSLAILASMVVALTVTPALCLILLRKAPLGRRNSPLVGWLQPRYERLLSRIVVRPRRAFAGATVLIVAAALVLPFMGSELFPAFKERDFLMHWITKPGTSLPEERRIVIKGSKELRSIEGVRNFGSHIGQAFLAEEVVGADSGENWISVAPDVDYDATVENIRDVVERYPGVFRDVQTYLSERIEEVITGSSDPITVRVFGDDLTVLRAKAAEVRDKISQVDGVDNAKVELSQDEPQLEVTVRLPDAERYGLKPGDVRRAAGVLMAGEEVGDIYRGGKTYDVQVWSTPESRKNIQDISNLPIDTPTGTKVRLADVADVRMAPTPNTIKHENTSRRIDVTAGVDKRDIGSVAADLKPVLAGMEFPRGTHAELLGEYAEREAAQRSILGVAVFALTAILFLLQTAFGNFRLAALTFLTLPMALVGGVLAAFSTGAVLSLGSLVGLFTVFGIAARNGIMLVSHYHHLERHEGMAFGPELVLRGARERLRPILMTALATGLAVTPLIVAGAIPGHEIEHPMAIVIVGGLLTSTLLNLFVMPVLYLRFGGRVRPASPP